MIYLFLQNTATIHKGTLIWLDLPKGQVGLTRKKFESDQVRLTWVN